MMMLLEEDITIIKLCINCFNCKKKGKKIYCKYGLWKEVDKGKSILHTPYDFRCSEWEEA